MDSGHLRCMAITICLLALTTCAVGCRRPVANRPAQQAAAPVSTFGAFATDAWEEPTAPAANGWESSEAQPETSAVKTPEAKAKPRDWPRWMGPNYDGVSDESGWSTDWPDKGLETVWTAEVGIGFSSITIANGRLYTMGHQQGKDATYCLDANNGELIWKTEADAPLVDNLYEGGPGSTPTIDGDFVYLVNKGGLLQCLAAADGETVWEVELQKDLEVELPEWGFNGSPYLLDDLLILEAGRVVAYDKKTGKKRWQTKEHTAGYGSAVHFQQDDRTLIATLDCEGLRIVAAKDGAEIATFPWSSPFRTNATTPKIIDGKIFISTAYNVGCGLFALRNDELELLYDNRDMRNHFNNSIYYEGKLYGFDGNSNHNRVVHLKCMDAKTGKIEWKQRGLGCGSLMIADGKLVVLSEDGRLVIAPATAKGFQPLTEAKLLDGRCWTVPLLLNGRIYARNASGNLICAKLPATE